MKGWLLANLFLIGMALIAAGFMFGTYTLLGLVWTDEDTKRVAIGICAVLTLFVSGLSARFIIKRIERRT